MPPAAAARWVPWNTMNAPIDLDLSGDGPLLRVLALRSDEWCAAFVETLASLPPVDQVSLPQVVRAVVLERMVPCPSGEAFVAWLSVEHSGRADLDGLRADPLTPTVLVGHLGTTACGRWEETAEVTVALCAERLISRDVVVAKILDVLTTRVAPRHARILARILAGLEVRSADVPGGLAYLLGVLGTADAAVVKVMLPLALDLATDPVDLVETVRAVAVRPEKRARTMVLTHLRTLTRSGNTPPHALLDALAELAGTPDAAFEREVAKVRALLAPQAAVEESSAAASTGMWEIPPTPSDDLAALTGAGVRDDLTEAQAWAEVLDGHENDATMERHVPVAVRALLVAQAAGEWSPEPLQMAATRAADKGSLNAARLARVLETVFLSGGLRGTWQAALDLTETALAQYRPSSGVAELLRTLGRYAVEVPVGWRPGDRLLALAQSSSASKARAEARVLTGLAPADPAASLDPPRVPDPVTVLIAENATPGRWSAEAVADVECLPEFPPRDCTEVLGGS